MVASKNGNLQIVEILLQNGADVNAKQSNGKTALIWATENGWNEIVKILLQYNASVNEKVAISNETALYFAVYKCSSEIVELLIEKKAEVNAVKKWDVTPLMVAAGHHQNEIVKVHIMNLDTK